MFLEVGVQIEWLSIFRLQYSRSPPLHPSKKYRICANLICRSVGGWGFGPIGTCPPPPLYVNVHRGECPSPTSLRPCDLIWFDLCLFNVRWRDSASPHAEPKARPVCATCVWCPSENRGTWRRKWKGWCSCSSAPWWCWAEPSPTYRNCSRWRATWSRRSDSVSSIRWILKKLFNMHLRDVEHYVSV